MKSTMIFIIGSIVLFPIVLLSVSGSVFFFILAAFYAVIVVAISIDKFEAFWRKYFNICNSFDEFLKSSVDE